MLKIYPVPALESNYFWLLQPEANTPACYIVDPGDAKPVLAALTDRHLTLAGILITHHHWDHTDGIDELLCHHSVPVYGPHSQRIPQVTHPLSDGDQLTLPNLILEVIGVPGHTLDHIAYFHQPEGTVPSVFCGDALFAAGCGRMFEGTPSQMLASLEKLAALPAATQVYCAHEYTLANLDFARGVEPDNVDVAARCIKALELRRQHKMTLPSSIGLEIRTNPFLRCHVPQVQRAAAQRSHQLLKGPADVFACLRQWKDTAKTDVSFLDHYGRNP